MFFLIHLIYLLHLNCFLLVFWILNFFKLGYSTSVAYPLQVKTGFVSSPVLPNRVSNQGPQPPSINNSALPTYLWSTFSFNIKCCARGLAHFITSCLLFSFLGCNLLTMFFLSVYYLWHTHTLSVGISPSLPLLIVNSVIRFGEILPFWQHVESIWHLFEGSFNIGQNFVTTLAIFSAFCQKSHCCKWPKIKQII